MQRTGFTRFLMVSSLLASAALPLHAVSMVPTPDGSTLGVMVAGVALIGIGRLRFRKR
jgi:hypothetical protein